MTDLEKLIERVAVGGPDREIDAMIGVAIGRFFEIPPKWDGGPVGYGYIDSDGAEVRPGNGGKQLVPFYTSSIDAAMTLVPRGWIIEICRFFNSDGEFVSAATLTDSFTVGRGCDEGDKVFVSARVVEQRQGIDPTPSAIVAASLRARLTGDPQ